MIDLHLHLDGSLSKEDFIYLLNKEGLPIPDNFPSCIYVPEGCKSLEEYLERFDLPCSLMQSKENLIYVTKSLVNRLYNLGYIYAEIRFASQLHTKNGLSQHEVIKAVLEGLKQGLKGKKDFNANLILCCMRQASDEINLETIKAVVDINDPKIVAIDLAGPEAFKPSLAYKDLFKYALDHNQNVIIHAGEACGNDSIMGAIDIGAKRIGHGVHLSFDEASIKKVKENHIFFEFCPTSNLQTTSLPNYESVPLKEFRNHNIPVTINSDNMTVSNTNVIDEFKHLYKTFKLSKDDVKYYLFNSVDAAFINQQDKERYKQLVKNKVDEFYRKIES